MADAQAGRAILELGAEGNRSTSQARLSWIIPACHHSQISIPSTLTRGPARVEGGQKERKKKGRPSSWDPWRALGPGWLVGWLVCSVAWAWQSSSKSQVASPKVQAATGPLPMRPCPHPPCPPPLPLPPHCWRGHGDSLTLLQIGLAHLVRLLAAGAAGAAECWCCRCWCCCRLYSTRSQSHKVTAGEGADSLTGLGLVWPPMHKTGRQSLSLSSLFLFCMSRDLAAPFLLLCSALPSYP